MPQVRVGTRVGGGILATGPLLRTSLLGTSPLQLAGPANVAPRKLWTFSARTFAGLGTFAAGTFSGYAALVDARLHDGWIGQDLGTLWHGQDGGILWRGSDLGVIWRGHQDMSIAGQLVKYVSDNRIYKFDFTQWAELISGEVLTSGTVTVDTAGLTVGAPVVVASLNQIQIRISGGTDGVSYKLTCLATTSGGDTLTQKGVLAVTVDP